MLVECYDPKADQWNILQTPILEGRSGPGCAVLDDSIVLVGGYSWSMVRSDIFYTYSVVGDVGGVPLIKAKDMYFHLKKKIRGLLF